MTRRWDMLALTRAVLGIVSLAFVTGLVNPNKKVNGLWLVVVAP